MLESAAGLCRRNRLFRRLHTALSLDSCRLDNGTAQSLGQLFGIDLVAVFPDNVHHVERNDHGNTHFGQLCSQV